MTAEEIQEEAWKEYIAYRRRNSRMTLEEAAEIARELGVDPEKEEDQEFLDDLLCEIE